MNLEHIAETIRLRKQFRINYRVLSSHSLSIELRSGEETVTTQGNITNRQKLLYINIPSTARPSALSDNAIQIDGSSQNNCYYLGITFMTPDRIRSWRDHQLLLPVAYEEAHYTKICNGTQQILLEQELIVPLAGVFQRGTFHLRERALEIIHG